MKMAITKVINGNFFIDSDGYTDIANVKTNAHALCSTLWNASDVITACVRIVDENLGTVDGFNEVITHAVPAAAEE